MKIWAISDLHLSLGNPDKSMEFFGGPWVHYVQKIEEGWRKAVQAEDLVLIAGDISWAFHLEDALIDLQWIDKLPGKKVLIQGNHDSWWSSKAKMEKLLPPSLSLIYRDSIHLQEVAIAGSRLWDSSEYHFDEYVALAHNPRASRSKKDLIHDEKVFSRELSRLEASLKSMASSAKVRIAMTHYPPIGANLKDSRVSRLFQKYGIQVCVFGHLHNVKRGVSLFGEKEGIRYLLTSCDFLDFQPLLI